MGKLLKPIIAAFIMGALAFMVFPQWVAWALPNSGHTPLSTTNTVDSGPPNIARSDDEIYTAIVWAEGVNGVGAIKLAYSQIYTTSRNWFYMTVDSNGSNPSLAFDPNNDTVVHVAYQKGTGNTGITYAKCTLGGSCNIQSLETGNSTYNYITPQIAVNTFSVTVIVYVRTNQLPDFTTVSRLFVAYIGSGGSVNKFEIGAGADYERNPVIARGSSNKLHVAYAADTDQNQFPDKIKYLRLGGTTVIATEETSVHSEFSPLPLPLPASEPDFPTIAAFGNTVALVWQMKYDTNYFVLGYNTSSDNGSTWVGVGSPLGDYQYILSNKRAQQTADPTLDVRLNTTDPTGPFRGGLRPAVTISTDNRMHVVWQEETHNRLDILYTYFNASQWRGTPILTLTTPLSYTNVTTVYGESEYNNKDGRNLGNADKARAKIVFGKPGNRAQIVYMSGKVSVSPWQVMYNGWQEGDRIGDPPNADSTLRQQDSDCDTLPDSQELLNTPPCATGAYQYNDNYAYNCNFNKDDVPDFMDVNSDGDYLPDDSDPQPRVVNSPPGIFLPIILKNH